MHPLGKRKRIYAIGMCLTVSLSFYGWRLCVCVRISNDIASQTCNSHEPLDVYPHTNMNWEWEKPSHCNHNARALNAQFNAQQNNWSRFLNYRLRDEYIRCVEGLKKPMEILYPDSVSSTVCTVLVSGFAFYRKF